MQDSFRRVGAAALLGAVVCLGAPQAQAVQCAIFARSVTGLELSGDAWQWWNHASGTYARGNAPKSGAVLVFMRSGPMRRGHVSVVSKVINSREILVDHANWGTRGAVARSVPVMDDSPNNDWSSVRVAFGGGFGRSNPTYGFIYDAAASAHDVVEAANHSAVDEQVADDRDEVIETSPRRHVSHGWIRLAVGHGSRRGAVEHGHGLSSRQSVRVSYSEGAHSRGSHTQTIRLISAPSHSVAHHEAAGRPVSAKAVQAKAAPAKSAPSHHEGKIASAGAAKKHRG